MGTVQSKDEILYNQARSGNQNGVKSLRFEGASLEWVDKKGKTPLILACSKVELLEMAETLLRLGANPKAYRTGTHGGFPLHHAAKRGLEKMVTLLLSHGADPLAMNDDGQTPLDMARSRGHAIVVRMLEERLCLFSGILRELSGPRIFETYAPQLTTNKVWVVVLPSESNPSRGAKHELVLYQAPKVSLWNGVRPSSHPAGLCNVSQPRTIISLAQADIGEPEFSLADPVLHIIDKGKKTKCKLLSENKGDKAQLERLYRVCKDVVQGIEPNALILLPEPLIHSQGGNPSQVHPQPNRNALSPSDTKMLALPAPPEASLSEDDAIALALDLSMRSNYEEVSPNLESLGRIDSNEWDDITPDEYYYNARSYDLSRPRECISEIEEGICEYNNGWRREVGSSSTSSSRISQDMPCKISTHRREANLAPILDLPSAPRLEYPTTNDESPIRYPILEDNEEAYHDYALVMERGKKMNCISGHLCVVCWDAPAEGVCVPCGHLAGCMSCLTQIKSKNQGCPVCRTQIEQMVKVYSV